MAVNLPSTFIFLCINKTGCTAVSISNDYHISEEHYEY